jgi:transketolase
MIALILIVNLQPCDKTDSLQDLLKIKEKIEKPQQKEKPVIIGYKAIYGKKA